MTINEAQGQSINNLGVYLPQPVIIYCTIESRFTSENKRYHIRYHRYSRNFWKQQWKIHDKRCFYWTTKYIFVIHQNFFDFFVFSIKDLIIRIQLKEQSGLRASRYPLMVIIAISDKWWPQWQKWFAVLPLIWKHEKILVAIVTINQ